MSSAMARSGSMGCLGKLFQGLLIYEGVSMDPCSPSLFFQLEVFAAPCILGKIGIRESNKTLS